MIFPSEILDLMVKRKSKQTSLRNKLVFLTLIPVIIIGLIFLIKKDATTSTPPYNYKLVYSYDNAIYTYDLKNDSIAKLKNGEKTVHYFSWNKTGQIAYTNEQGELFILDPQKEKSIKLSPKGFKDIIFWDNDSTLYANQSPIQIAFHYKLNGDKEQINTDEYNRKLQESLTNVVYPASFDKRYASKSDFTKSNIKTFLIDNIKNKEYKMPDGAFRPQLSSNNFYVSYNNNATNADGFVYIYKLSDAKSGKFEKPIYKKDLGTYEWIDKSKILFVKKTYTANNLQNNTYAIFDLKTGKEKDIYQVLNSPVYVQDVFISPDKTKLILRKFNKDFFSGGELIFVDLDLGKEIKKIPFNYGEWSEPL